MKPSARPPMRPALGFSSAKDREHHQQGREGGQGVDDPGQDGRDVSLPVGEEGEREAVEHDGEHEQMSPD